MGDYFTNPVRHPEDVGVGALRRRFSYADFGAGGASIMLPMGALEKGAIPLSGTIIALTGVAGGTPKVDVGTAGSATAFGTGAGAAATPVALAGASIGVAVTADTIVYVRLNAGATAGDFDVTLNFVNKRDAAAGLKNTPPGVTFRSAPSIMAKRPPPRSRGWVAAKPESRRPKMSNAKPKPALDRDLDRDLIDSNEAAAKRAAENEAIKPQSFVYNPDPGDPDEVTVYGIKFKEGASVKVEDPEVIRKLRGNPTFMDDKAKAKLREAYLARTPEMIEAAERAKQQERDLAEAKNDPDRDPPKRK